ncbi:MAG: hypothetical protein ACOVOQ_04675 [Flavobacterium sp.]
MKYFITLFFSLPLLVSCAGIYDMSGKDYIGKTGVRELSVREYEPVESKSFLAEDKNLSIIYIPTIVDAGVVVQFKNKTDKPIKIIWDESVYMSPSGSSEGIFHLGVTIADRSANKTPTILPPRASHSDEMIINSLVSFYSSQYGSGWSYTPICGIRNIYDHTLDDSSCKDKVFGFYVTYEINGKKEALTFKYKYVGSKPKTKGTN